MDAVSAYGKILIEDPERIGVTTALGLDETLFACHGRFLTQAWSTSIVGLDRPAQLLDVVPGRSAKRASEWIDAQPEVWRDAICWGVLDLSGPYRKTFTDSLPTATQVADPMLLLLSSSDWDNVGRCEEAVDIEGDVALEAAHRASRGVALANTLVDVRASSWVPPKADNHDAPQRHVGLAVAATVESVPILFAGGALQRRHPAECGEGGLAAESLGVVAGSDHERGGDIVADTLELEQPGRGCLGHNRLELGGEVRGFGVQGLPAGRARLRTAAS